MLKTIAGAIAIAAFLHPAPCAAQVRNLTEENRKALSDKVLELRHTELLRVTRGRLKTNPIILPFFGAYQTLTQNQDLLLGKQLDNYRSALLEMAAADRDFAPWLATPAGKRAAAIFNTRAVAAYTLAPRIEKLEKLWDVWHEIKTSNARLESLPVEYRLALNTGKWLDAISAGAPIPPEISDRFFALCAAEPAETNVFDADAAVSEISQKYSRLAADFAAIRKAENKP